MNATDPGNLQKPGPFRQREHSGGKVQPRRRPNDFPQNFNMSDGSRIHVVNVRFYVQVSSWYVSLEG